MGSRVPVRERSLGFVDLADPEKRQTAERGAAPADLATPFRTVSTQPEGGDRSNHGPDLNLSVPAAEADLAELLRLGENLRLDSVVSPGRADGSSVRQSSHQCRVVY